jgi:hypothetical protein
MVEIHQFLDKPNQVMTAFAGFINHLASGAGPENILIIVVVRPRS